MKWLILGMMAAGLALVVFGLSVTQGGGSADERVGGALPVLLGIGIIGIDLVVAFIWLVARG